MIRSDDEASSPVLAPTALIELGHRILAMTTAERTVVYVDHRAMGTARVIKGRVQQNRSGDELYVRIASQFGRRMSFSIGTNQIDMPHLRQAVEYVERVAREQPGDGIETAMRIAPRVYLRNTTSHANTIAAFSDARHAAVETLVAPVVAAGLRTSAFVGVTVHSRLCIDKQGMEVAGQETDSELTVTAWNANGKGSGWAGQSARDWATLQPGAVADRVIRLTKLAANPVTFEPGRRTAILDRPAVAQIVCMMGWSFHAGVVLNGRGPLWDKANRRVRFGQRLFDARITLSSDPNDPDGGYLPFNDSGMPLVPMTWIGTGAMLEHLAYSADMAAKLGVTPPNDAPNSLRMSGGPSNVEEMIANCKEGIYVNRVAQLSSFDESGIVTGITNGGCYLVRNGKIEKSIRNFRFVESPWLFLNRVEAIGAAERAPFGYSPWNGGWPAAPTIVPPLMIRDFNFTALADVV